MNEYEIIAQPGDIYWEIPEYIKHERSKTWYIVAGLLALGCAVISIMTPNYVFETPNYLFLGIIILGTFIMLMNDGVEPVMVPVILGDEGVQVGRKFYDYDEIKNFSVIFKPREDIKNIYLEFKAIAKPRISVPIGDQDPLVIRNLLLKYLVEDLDRTSPPASEGIAKMLKL